MKHSASEEKLRNFQEEQNIPVPILENKPVLRGHLGWIWEFFIKLNLNRQSSGFGSQPISYSEILALASLERIWYSEDIEELVFFIPRIDAEYLSVQEELRKSKQAAQTKAPSSRRPRR